MLTTKDNRFLETLITKHNKNKDINLSYPLLDNAFSNEDILEGIKVLLSQQLTMSEITYNFENAFAKHLGSKHAVMVNSGSSANLLASFALINPKKRNRVNQGDHFLIPALCWSTSLWPLIQCGLKPIFMDVNIKNFCLDERKISKKITDKIRVILTIHILGNSSNIQEISSLAKKNDIYLIEDTCEALGSKYNSKFLGTFGDFGTYSFYYSHQITAGEGGMIVTNSRDDYNLLCSLRSHGWDRKIGKKIKKHNSYFNFVNSGFNVRPTDITAAIGFCQFKRLDKLIKVRKENRLKIINKLKSSNNWNNQFDFFYPNKKVTQSFFGFPILINKKYIGRKIFFLDYLMKKKIETRPILSGNFLNQPSAKLYNLNQEDKKFPCSQEIEDRGFFIGIPSKPLNNQTLNFLVENLLKI